MATYSKASDTEIERVMQAPQPAPVTTKFARAFLEQQKKDIQASKDAYDAQRDIELAEVNEMLAECDKLNIVEKVAELMEGV